MKIGRRRFLESSGACLLGAAAGGIVPFFGRTAPAGRRPVLMRLGSRVAAPGFGPLRRDPDGLLDLSRGLFLQARLRRRKQDGDGFIVPSLADGMGAFPGPVRIDHSPAQPRVPDRPSGRPRPVRGEKKLWTKLDTRLSMTGPGRDVPASARSRRSFTARSGRRYERAPQPGRDDDQLLGRGDALGDVAVVRGGLPRPRRGVAPAGTATRSRSPSRPRRDPATPLPLTAMGRFEKEGVAFDPRPGSFIRPRTSPTGSFIGSSRPSPAGFAEGGKLQALAVTGQPGFDTNNWRIRAIETGQVFESHWLDVDDPDPDENVLRLRGREKGAAVFASSERHSFITTGPSGSPARTAGRGRKDRSGATSRAPPKERRAKRTPRAARAPCPDPTTRSSSTIRTK